MPRYRRVDLGARRPAAQVGAAYRATEGGEVRVLEHGDAYPSVVAGAAVKIVDEGVVEPVGRALGDAPIHREVGDLRAERVAHHLARRDVDKPAATRLAPFVERRQDAEDQRGANAEIDAVAQGGGGSVG